MTRYESSQQMRDIMNRYDMSPDDEPIEIIDEDGIAHGYTAADYDFEQEDEGDLEKEKEDEEVVDDEDQKFVCNNCGHTFVLEGDDEAQCPNCDSDNYDTE